MHVKTDQYGGSTIMRRQLSTAAVVIALAATATACNSDGVDAKPEESASAAQSPAPQDPKGPGSAQDKPAQDKGGSLSVGGTATLKAKNGAQIAVTLKNFADPATSDNKYMQPKPGKRWVAAQFEIVNKGQTVYDDSPGNGVKVVDDQGQAFTQSIGSTTAGPSMPATVKLKAGEKALGYVVVSVPEKAKPKSVTFTPDSGYGKETGQWTVAK
ncbi:DUF4352 domain-containing protein [Streptomyces sp. SCA3-4]|uniref:DUF4352 domain-containing protein n=1 Tax=Streptomyces sichuanensis TaxID=2871810 RepID=UPI001CE2E182|nr:DUF4352 domain-containing protein [Streptomyces sichuanensis]MCA6094250.1 DUF4352 domain-containing protein [Streptomyces sichuanensis]